MGNTPIEIDPANVKLRRQQPEALAKIVKEIRSGEVEKPFTIKLKKIDNDRGAYAIPSPTADEPDNLANKKKFFAVVLFSKTHWSAPMDGSSTEKTVEQRLLTLLRCTNGIPKGEAGHMQGAVYPEIMFVSSSSIDVVKGFTKKALGPKPGCWELESVQQALVEFTTEPAHKKLPNGTVNYWHKPVMTIVRALTDVEYAYVQELAEAVKERNDKFTRDDEIDDYEARAFGKQKAGPTTEKDPEAATREAVAHREIAMDDDIADEDVETEEAKKARIKKEKAEKKAADEAAAKKAEEAEAAKPKSSTPAASDDIDDEDAAVSNAKGASTGGSAKVADDIDDLDD